MGVARCRLDVVVTEQLADYRQRLPERERTGRKAVSEVVQPNVIQSGPGPDGLPEMVEGVGDEASVPIVAGKHPGTVLPSRQRFEQPHRSRRKLNRTGTGLGVGEVELAGVEVDIGPAQGEDLAFAAAGQHQKADRRHGRRRTAPAGDGLVQYPAKAGELGIGQEALARPLREFLDRPAGIETLRRQAPAFVQLRIGG